MNAEGVGYILGTMTVPFILGWIFTKRWYYGLMIAIAWLFFRFSQPRHESYSEPMSKQIPGASIFATPSQ